MHKWFMYAAAVISVSTFLLIAQRHTNVKSGRENLFGRMSETCGIFLFFWFKISFSNHLTQEALDGIMIRCDCQNTGKKER